MPVRPLSRRTLLRGACGAAVALPFLDAMTPLSAVAQSSALPKRFLLFFTGNGHPPEDWRVSSAPQGASDIAGLPLSRVLAPLEAVKGNCTFVEGLPMRAGNRASNEAQTAVAHAAGSSTLLTGGYAPPGEFYGGVTNDGDSGYPTHESVDQIMARAVGQETRFPTLHMSVHRHNDSMMKRLFYQTATGGRYPTTPIAPETSPSAIFNKVFPGSTEPEPTTGVPQADRDAAVLDAVMSNAKQLRCQLGYDDRQRLEQHMEHLRDLERSLGAGRGTGEACETPLPPQPGSEPDSTSNYVAALQQQQMLMTMAMTCDLARIGGLLFGLPLDGFTHTWLGQTEGHHNMTHEPDQIEQCLDVNVWQAQQFRALIELFKNTPEAGGSLLDNSVILWTTECALDHQGDIHDINQVGFTLAGGGGGHFKTGQYVKYRQEGVTEGISHNNLLLTLAQYMGADVETVGMPEFCQHGPLTELLM